MAFKNNNAAKPVKTPLMTYNTARANLLLVVVFTAVNLVLTLVSADMYFLFSATVPQFILSLGYAMENSVLLTVCAVIAFLGCGVYLLCWLLSKKHRAWMVVSLVLFALDTLVSLWMLTLDTSMLIDVAIHGWVLYYLITGTVAVVKMKNNPELAVEPAPEQPAEFVAPVYEVPAETAQPVAPAESVVAEPAPVVAEPVFEAPAAPAPQVMVNGEPMQE